MGHNPTKVLARVGVNGTSRARVLLGLLRVILVLVSVLKDRKLQQVMVIFAGSVAAVTRGLVTLAVAEGDKRATETTLQRPVALLVVAVGEPVWIAAARVAIGQRCRVQVAHCAVLAVFQSLSAVLALPGLSLELADANRPQLYWNRTYCVTLVQGRGKGR